MTATVTTTADAVKATPKAAPTPSVMKTSGDYGADLAAAGVVPDSVTRSSGFMEEKLCDALLTTRKPFDYTEFLKSVRTIASTAPGDIATVRLSVSCFCPERIALAEEALLYHGYTK
ncbi:MULTISPECIES: hypothetical protein [Pseudarthrobacter]|uniref:hypothetical protein n=1 Tax=Pseudarthrobacter TaxID=1742993 RepID=UPI00203C7987|nr:hypothetical protein [Pseudarthrobacter sp. NCCP-2145]